MGTSPKDARIELRVTAAQKEAIESAAAISGRTVTAFSTEVLTER
ncbi:type II toxin -antitoxin system TacA 1-like antitoxin, partial [Vibrio parahaemolyticus]